MATSGVWKYLSDLEPPGAGPWLWANTSMLGVDFEVEAANVAHWLPFGLRPAKVPRATMLVADYQSSVFGNYREVGLILHARFGLLPVRFWAWMIVDNDAALIFGREIAGVPKKLGTIDVEIEGDELRARLDRKGTRLVELEATLGTHAPKAPPLMGHWSVNVRGNPGMALPSLIAFHTAEEVLEARHAAARVTVRSSDSDPIGQLDLGQVVGAHWYRTNFGGTEKLPAFPVTPVNPKFLTKHWDLRCT